MRDKLEKFGIGCLLDTNFGPYNQPEPDRDTIKRCIDQLIEEGMVAEQVGFDGIFVPECHMHTETVFERSREAAEHLGSKIVKPEHMAIALMSVKAGSCYETLKEFSIDPSYVRLLVMESMGLETEFAPEWF